MGWCRIEELQDGWSGEIVIRLSRHNKIPVIFLGDSVHQIAMVTGGGDVFCKGSKLQPEWIEGWLELPPPNRENN